MKQYKILMLFVLLLGLSSCGTLTKNNSFSAKTELRMNMNDLVFLGESEISCEYDTYLGFIRQLNKVNGEQYVPGSTVKLNIDYQGLSLKGKGMQMAAAKLLKEYPEGRYFQIVMETSETDVMFLGSTTRRCAKVRVYKFK